MSTNGRFHGTTLEYTNTSGQAIVAGEVVIVRAGASGMAGIAINDIPDQTSGPLSMEGVFNVPCDPGYSPALGASVSYDTTDDRLEAAGSDRIGTAWGPRDANDMVPVKLIGR